MILRFKTLKKAVDIYITFINNRENEKFSFSSTDWENVDIIVDILAPFMIVSKR